MDPHHFNFHLNHTQAMLSHPPPPTSSPPQSVPGRRYDTSQTIIFHIIPLKTFTERLWALSGWEDSLLNLMQRHHHIKVTVMKISLEQVP